MCVVCVLSIHAFVSYHVHVRRCPLELRSGFLDGEHDSLLDEYVDAFIALIAYGDQN